jgi:hypothetical protein
MTAEHATPVTPDNYEFRPSVGYGRWRKMHDEMCNSPPGTFFKIQLRENELPEKMLPNARSGLDNVAPRKYRIRVARNRNTGERVLLVEVKPDAP